MSGIFSLLAVKKTELKTGIVEGKTKAGVTVRIGKDFIVMPAATSDDLPIGARVVIGDAGNKQYIIGKEKFDSKEFLEMRING